jgi:hypothetical protein
VASAVTGRSGVCQLSIQAWREEDERGGGTERTGARDQGHTYGGSSFRLRRTRTRRKRPRCSRVLSSPFPRFAACRARVVVVGGEELAQSLTPELVSFGFREVGVLNQKCLAIPRDGPREQFIVGQVDSHARGPGREWNCLSVFTVAQTWVSSVDVCQQNNEGDPRMSSSGIRRSCYRIKT